MNKTEIYYKCLKCNQIKSVDEFPKDKKAKNGLRSTTCCHKCLMDSIVEGRRQRRGCGKSRDEITEEQLNYRLIEQARKKIAYEKNQIRALIRGAKARAKKQGLDFNLNHDNIKKPEVCPILGIPLIKSDKYPSAGSASIDRFDKSKGYTEDNINIISMRANTIKTDATFEEFEAVYKWWKAELTKREKKLCPNTTSE
jgi:hypothetical protein